MTESIKILIAEDHNILLQGLKNLLLDDNSFDLCATENNCRSALVSLKKYQPDILLTDISFPDGDGISLFKNARIYIPELKAICLTMHREQGYVSKAYQAGINGYLPKETDIEEIKRVIKGVMLGQKFYDPSLFDFNQNSQKTQSLLKEKLSLREIEIIQLIADGLSSKDIADRIHLSPFTIDTHRKNINSKLNVKNVGELLKVAREEGIIL
ncbi:MAG: response regulator transcription factor [bacterium]|nr:response regulator transcription factor [bacterium]